MDTFIKRDALIIVAVLLLCGVFVGVANSASNEEETVEEDVTALSKTSHALVGGWDTGECGNALREVRVRLQCIQKDKHGLYVKEGKIKKMARNRGDLPVEYKRLAAEIKEMKKEITEKTILLGKYMNNLDEVKALHGKRKDFDKEWRRLSVLSTVINARIKDLKKNKAVSK